MADTNLATVETMWRREVEAAHTYKLLAEREPDPKRRDLLLRMAEQEDKHAARWAERIALATGHAPDPKEIERGLTWAQVAADIGVSAATITRTKAGGRLEVDGMLAMVGWLGVPVETFVRDTKR